MPKSYDVDQEKLKVEYSQLKEKLKVEYSQLMEKLNPAEFAGRMRERWLWAEGWNERVDCAYEVVHYDLNRALYLLNESFGVCLHEEDVVKSLIDSELAMEISEVSDALDAATNAEELAAIRKISSDRFNETAAALSPAFAATLASDAHDIRPLCTLVLRLQYLHNAVHYSMLKSVDERSEGGDAYGWVCPGHFRVGRWYIVN
ncbi:hypothetical protein JCM1840_006685 [Sporobolomyces johnsonii]